ncbi:MAG TPA: helix-turn-helix domain-containing protein [Chitinophaga sp.]|uniref:helix-turn-helix domain-containing protein n=1 Tax=Chitinophaga sp. TaxID=1869181 RepID=UPI002C9D164D|nr:helix-turn-helix domain-containing protein [Chitinophaga sp.]HVI49023.1 helix-turn-helix domain-containing protein [Chitinophaga sp.]
MAAEILTREDLAIFKTELFQELRELVHAPVVQSRKWLKSHKVRDMLGISIGTLQSMRIKGTISFTKIGGIIFYEYDDIIKLMEGSRKTVKRS